MYQPNPLDTSDVTLSPELLELTEVIARQVHENWAKGRMEEGWRYGALRDDGAKRTPCLVPYEDLPEFEKEYDRVTAMGTLKLITKLGYTLVKNQP